MQVGKVSMSQQVKEFNGFRLSIHEDCTYLADKLRYEDKREILDASGFAPYGGLLKSYVNSEVCFTIVDKDNVPVGMFGVSKDGGISVSYTHLTLPTICSV